ncbi:serine/threonine-protein kinase pakC [Acrasis kona]|uniref:Serine/threonine-protein kinase pakC n=1 Tax=Acrasis kona TaxID=1008807 RepID=A0AAW2ZN53_9EUKA
MSQTLKALAQKNSPVPPASSPKLTAVGKGRSYSASGIFGKFIKPKQKEHEISHPFNTKHVIHVDFDIETGLSGMPEYMDVSSLGPQMKVGRDSVYSAEEVENNSVLKRSRNSIINTMQLNKEPEPISSTGRPKSFTESPLTSTDASAFSQTTFKELYPPTLTLRSTKPVASDDHLCDFVNTSNPRTEFIKMVKIGTGSSGDVYKAIHAKSGQKVAVKVMSIGKDTKLDMFENEISMMRQCEHKNMVNFFDCYSTEEELWISMEYVSGGKLTDMLHVDYTESEIAAILKETLLALDYLHKKNIIHRDVKSDNILITRKGKIKLADFGFTCVLDDKRPKRRSVVGTPYWMAPEVVRAQEYDTLIDVWSLGIMALEMANGEVPRLEYPPIKALFVITTNPPPTLDNPDQWSESFINFLDQCLVKDVSVRSTCQQLLQHPFIQKACTLDFLLPLINQMRRDKRAKNKDGVEEIGLIKKRYDRFGNELKDGETEEEAESRRLKEKLYEDEERKEQELLDALMGAKFSNPYQQDEFDDEENDEFDNQEMGMSFSLNTFKKPKDYEEDDNELDYDEI